MSGGILPCQTAGDQRLHRQHRCHNLSRDIARQIRQQEADYVLVLKGNQDSLHKDVELYFEDAEKHQFGDIPFDYHETADGEHARIETRSYGTDSDTEWIEARDKWSGLNPIGMVESTRKVGEKVKQENG